MYQKLAKRVIMNSKIYKLILCLVVVGSLSLTSYSTSMAIPTTEDSQVNPNTLLKLKQSTESIVEHFKKYSSKLKVTQRMDRIGPALLLNMDYELGGGDLKEQAAHFISQFAPLWGQLKVTIEKIETRKDRSVVHLVGEINGVPVSNQQSKLTIKNGKAQHLSNGLGALAKLIQSRVEEADAIKAAKATLGDQAGKLISVKKVAVSYEPAIAHEIFELRFTRTNAFSTWIVLVDGRDGAVIKVTTGELK